MTQLDKIIFATLGTIVLISSIGFYCLGQTIIKIKEQNCALQDQITHMAKRNHELKNQNILLKSKLGEL